MPSRNDFLILPNSDVAIFSRPSKHGRQQFTVDAETWQDAREYSCWSVLDGPSTKYAIHSASGTLLHRLAMTKELADGLMVDHINRDTFDCRRSNLRMATLEQSQLNRAGWGDPDLPRGVDRLRRRDGGFRARTKIRGDQAVGPIRETAEEAGRDWDDLMRAGHPPENWPFIQWNAVTSHFAGSRNSPVASFGSGESLIGNVTGTGKVVTA